MESKGRCNPDEPRNAGEPSRAAGIDLTARPMHRLPAAPNPLMQLRFVSRFWPDVRTIRRLIRERDIDLVQKNGLVNPHGTLVSGGLALACPCAGARGSSRGSQGVAGTMSRSCAYSFGVLMIVAARSDEVPPPGILPMSLRSLRRRVASLSAAKVVVAAEDHPW